MQCPFRDHPSAHRHSKTSKGSQRYCCPMCQHTFTETFDSLSYRRQVTPEQTHTLLQAHSEGSRLREVKPHQWVGLWDSREPDPICQYQRTTSA